MGLITILNRCHRFQGFVYDRARFRADHNSIEVLVRPRKGSAAICSRCHPQELSPRQLVMRYCELDSQGEQLSPSGWQRVATLFVAPGAPHHDKIMVVRDFDITRPVPQDGKIGFVVYYKLLGSIDREARFTPLPQDAEVRGVIKSSTNVSSEWRLEGPVPGPTLKLNAAIRHATVLRANAKDPAIRKNADRTLYMLKRLR